MSCPFRLEMTQARWPSFQAQVSSSPPEKNNGGRASYESPLARYAHCEHLTCQSSSDQVGERSPTITQSSGSDSLVAVAIELQVGQTTRISRGRQRCPYRTCVKPPLSIALLMMHNGRLLRTARSKAKGRSGARRARTGSRGYAASVSTTSVSEQG